MVNRIRRKAGEKHGKLILVETITLQNGKRGWLCKCECGNMTSVRHDSMKCTHSCGCLRIGLWKEKKRHGGYGTKAYNVWQKMRARCYNKNHPQWKNYGARGIYVCIDWKNDFSTFLRDMGQPEAGMSIDRINNDGPYSKENCRWTTSKVQANNRRSNVFYKGLTFAQWGKITGLSNSVLYYRINKMGMSVEDAVSTPLMRQRTSKA